MRNSTRPSAIAALALTLAFLGATASVAHATTASVSPEGNLLIDGEPVFPVGIYHVSWIGNRQGVKAVPDLHLLADAGFNLMHPTVDARNDMIDLLDAAAARGVYLIGEIPWPANGPDAFINKWKSHPAMIGWYIADDFNTPYAGPSYNHPPAEIAARHAHVHALAPGHVSHASGGSYPGFRISEFAGLMDVMGFQSYPLGAQNNPDEYALQENMDSFDWVRDELAGTGQLFIANPQAYRWSGSRYPTPREARNFLYAPLIRGAKGVSWYAMWEGGGRYLPTAAPDLWADLKRTNAELKSLTPFLLFGARTELATGNPRVHAASWLLDDQVVVVALSTHRTQTFSIWLDLPAGATGPAHGLFPSRAEAGMSVVAGDLAGNVAPEDVHVYVIDLPIAGNDSPTAAFTVSPSAPTYGQAATLDASSSSDTDGSVVEWSWDFGDGTLATGETAGHTWTSPGTHYVRLTARDEDGAPDTSIVPVQVGITSLCAPTPAPACASARSTLKIREGIPARRSLDFAWKRGAIDFADLGDPTGTTEYALCVYDAGGLAIATGIQPGSEWSALGSSGFRARDAAAHPGGVSLVKLKAGAGTKGSVSVKGKGIHLPALSLPLVLPVTAQVVRSGASDCWQGVYTAGAQSTAQQFKGSDG